MSNVVTNACKLFAGDAKSFTDVSIPDGKLQEDIDNLCLSTDKWELSFNESKCKCLNISRNNPGRSYVTNVHIMEDVSFQRPRGEN